ncbi:MAG: addiction module protein [Pyrinomonadaceae bacterium]
MSTSEEIFQDAVALPPDVRAELAERLIASLADEISPKITSALVAEVRRRIAQVEAGEATLIPGDEALARARNLLAAHLPSSCSLHYCSLPFLELSFVYGHHT